MDQKNERNLNDFCFINEVDKQLKRALDAAVASKADEPEQPEDGLIEIFDEGNSDISIVYTYSKFFEILDSEGLSGLVNS